MTAFTIDYNQQVGESPDLDLTRSMLEKAYRLGLLSPAEFGDYLREMGYNEKNAAFIQSILDQDISLDRAYDWISILRNQVGAGLVTVQEAGSKLSALGLSDEAVQHYEVIFSSYVEEPSKIPSKTDVKAWVSGDIIDPTEGSRYLKALGYGQQEIDRYIRQWLGSEDRYTEWVEFMKSAGAR